MKYQGIVVITHGTRERALILRDNGIIIDMQDIERELITLDGKKIKLTIENESDCMPDYKTKAIKEIKFTEGFRRAFMQEFQDLMLFLHRDDSTGDLDHMTERFLGKAIAYSLPTLCNLHEILNVKGELIDRISLIFDIERT